MTFLPIIERELRVRAQRVGTHWARFAVAAFGVLVCLMQITLNSAVGSVAAAGSAAFHALVGAAFLLCCAACLITADAISSERREGTLGLLFLTRVKGHDVLLGKLASAALAGLCAVLAFLPVLVIPVLSGGVTGGETFRKGLVLLDTLFLALAVGLWASAYGQDWLSTARRALLLMVAIVVVPPVYSLLTRDLPPWSHAAAAFSPFTGLMVASDLTYRTSPGQFWASLVLIHLCGWALLWQASVVLRRNLHETEPGAAVADDSANLAALQVVSRTRLKPLKDHDEPIAWLVSRQRGLWLAIWAGVLLALSYRLLNPLLFRFVSPGGPMQVVLWPVSLVLNIGKAALFAWAASRFFIETRRTNDLELLLTTPCGAAGMVAGQWGVLKRLFRWPVVVLVLMSLLQAGPIFWRWSIGSAAPWMTAPWGIHYAVSVGIGCVLIYIGVLALCWTGLWFGLTARNQSSAIMRTVGLVTVVPYLVAWGFSLAASTLARFIPSSGGPSLFYLLSSWLSNLLVILYYLWLIHRGKRLLSGDLRQAGLQSLELGRELGELWRDGLSAVRRARRWTPS